MHNLLTSHGNKDGNRDLLDFVQPDDVDVSQHWKRTLLPWLPAKRFFVSKRSLQEAQSKKISHDLEGKKNCKFIIAFNADNIFRNLWGKTAKT